MLTLRKIAIDTYRENVAFLRRCCTVFRPEEFQALNKIEIGRDGRKILATLNIVDDERILSPGEIGLSDQAFRMLGVAEGERVRFRKGVTEGSREGRQLLTEGKVDLAFIQGGIPIPDDLPRLHACLRLQSQR